MAKYVFRMANEVPPMKVLPTGIASLDFCSRIGGLPLGAQVEVYGAEGTGKSLLGYYVIAEAQRRGLPCCLLDLEGMFDEVWAKKTAGVEISKLAFEQPAAGTEAMKYLEAAIDQGHKVIVFDSLGAMVEDKTLDDIEKSSPGGAAKMITHMVCGLNKKIRDNECLVLYTNHIRDKMGADTMRGASEYTQVAPGGRAKEHMMVQRIYLRQGSFVDEKSEDVDSDNKIGQMITAKFVKNKKAPPRKKALWNMYTEPGPNGVLGIDTVQSVIDVAVNYGIFEKTGAWYNHSIFPKKLNGVDNVATFLREDPKRYRVIHQEVIDLTAEMYLKEKTDVL